MHCVVVAVVVVAAVVAVIVDRVVDVAAVVVAIVVAVVVRVGGVVGIPKCKCSLNLLVSFEITILVAITLLKL